MYECLHTHAHMHTHRGGDVHAPLSGTAHTSSISDRAAVISVLAAHIIWLLPELELRRSIEEAIGHGNPYDKASTM